MKGEETNEKKIYDGNGHSKLQAVTIPNTVKELGKFSFSECKELKEVIVPSGVKIIDHGAFWGCSNLSKLRIEDGVEEIGEHAFSDCISLVEVEIPSSVKKIGSYAFPESLKTIKLNEGLEQISQSSFGLRLPKEEITITLPSTVKYVEGSRGPNTNIDFKNNDNFYIDEYGVIYSKDRKVLMGTINDMNVDVVYVIPEGVTTINAFALNGQKITQVSFPSALTTINKGAFSGCEITNIDIPESVERIGERAFDKVDTVTLHEKMRNGSLDMLRTHLI